MWPIACIKGHCSVRKEPIRQDPGSVAVLIQPMKDQRTLGQRPEKGPGAVIAWRVRNFQPNSSRACGQRFGVPIVLISLENSFDLGFGLAEEDRMRELPLPCRLRTEEPE